MTEDPREAKLPKWAQQELHRLRSNLTRAETKLAAGPENSNTFADRRLDEARPLGTDTRITFRMGEKFQDYIDCNIEHYKDTTYLRVMGGDGIAIVPQASNVVHIHSVRM